MMALHIVNTMVAVLYQFIKYSWNGVISFTMITCDRLYNLLLDVIKMTSAKMNVIAIWRRLSVLRKPSSGLIRDISRHQTNLQRSTFSVFVLDRIQIENRKCPPLMT